MRICQVTASWGDGGLEKHILELILGLREAGHEVSVIGHPDWAAKLPPDVRLFPADFEQARFSLPLLRSLLRVFRAERFDIVHAQANKAASLVKMLRLFMPGETARVATLHNEKKRLSMFRGFDRVIAVSGRLAALLPGVPVSVVYNSVVPPAPGISRAGLLADCGFPDDQPLLCGVGRLVPAKGFDLLVDAWKTVPARLVIMGEGPDRPLLEQKIRESGQEDRIRLAGFLPDAAARMAACDGLVISSRNEGGPYTLGEAVLAGIPVVSTEVGIVPEFLPPELVVPVNDIPALAERLTWAVTHPDAWAGRMAAVRERAAVQLSPRGMIDGTVDAYRQALAGRGR